jgi:hypothetical protein
MSSLADKHTPLPLKRSISDSLTPSAEAKKSSPGSFDDIDELIADHIEQAEESCPVALVENFSVKYPNFNIDKLFSDHREVRLAITCEDTLILKTCQPSLTRQSKDFLRTSFV